MSVFLGKRIRWFLQIRSVYQSYFWLASRKSSFIANNGKCFIVDVITLYLLFVFGIITL